MSEAEEQDHVQTASSFSHEGTEDTKVFIKNPVTPARIPPSCRKISPRPSVKIRFVLPTHVNTHLLQAADIPLVGSSCLLTYSVRHASAARRTPRHPHFPPCPAPGAWPTIGSTIHRWPGNPETGKRRREMIAAREKRRAPGPRKPTREEIRHMTTAEYMRYRCKDRKSTIAYFKEIGVSWDKDGNATVRPM